jgi:NAD(P)H-hydrate epimerase
MQKILDPQQTQAWDAYTLTHGRMASIDLMERACQAFVDWFVSRWDASWPVLAVCGPGNNGGDGLGIARLLHHWNYRVTVWMVHGPATPSADCAENQKRLPPGVEWVMVSENLPPVPGRTIIIDALFGSGLNRPLTGIFARVTELVNQAAQAVRVAVDVPSGLQTHAPSTGVVFRAHHTVTFQSPKLAFLLPQAAPFVGRWHVVNIGLSKEFLKDAPARHFYVTRRAVRGMLPLRDAFAHKGMFGHALMVAGSRGKMGAALLAARAALRTGAGLVTACVPQCGNEVMQTALPEVMTQCDAGQEFLTGFPDVTPFDAVGIGPGIGTRPETMRTLELALAAGVPLVLDADALNLLAANPQLLERLPPGAILTPHPKEFERLAGAWRHDFERLERQSALAQQRGAVVVVKGRHTTIATPDGNLYFNSTGNPGMATAGSGDVLTGMITALRAQGLPPADSALAGVYLHGLAGDKAAEKLGEISLIASDIISYVPKAVISVLR